MPKPDSDDIAVALTPGMMMKARRSLIALLLCRSDALSTTAGPPRSLFLAKHTVPAKALVEFFSANGCSVTDVDVHTRLAFASLRRAAARPRASAENGPYEAKRAHVDQRRNATAAAAWDALCAKLARRGAPMRGARSHRSRRGAARARPRDAGGRAGRRRAPPAA